MKIFRVSFFSVVAIALFPALLGSQTTDPPKNPPEIIKLTLHAAAVTPQSLQYKLLPPVTDQTPGDAAALYLLAAHLGPDQKAAGDLVGKALDKYGQTPLDQLAKSDLESALSPFSTRLKYVEMAARRDRANFGFTLREEGFEALLPYLNDLRTNANLLGLKLRLQIARKDWEGAINTLQTGFGMCQQLNDHAVLVQGLVATGMADLLLARLREWGTQSDSPNLYWSLTELPQPFINIRIIGQWEQAMPFLSFPQLAHLKSRPLTSDEWRAVFGEMARLKPRPQDHAALAWMVAATYARATRSLISQGESKDQLEAMTPNQVVGTYLFRQFQAAAAETWKGWDLPFWQFIQVKSVDLDETPDGQSREGANPLMIMLPAVRRAKFQFARLDREICIARTIEALRDYAARHEGEPPASLGDVKDLPIPLDPVTGQPFPYRIEGKVAVIEPAISIQASQEIFELTFVK